MMASIPAAIAEVGDTVVVGGQYTTVTSVFVGVVGDFVEKRVHTPLGVRKFSHGIDSYYRGAELDKPVQFALTFPMNFTDAHRAGDHTDCGPECVRRPTERPSTDAE